MKENSEQNEDFKEQTNFVIKRENKSFTQRIISLNNKELAKFSALAFVLIATGLIIKEIGRLLQNLAIAGPTANPKMIWGYWLIFFANLIAFVAAATAGIILANLAFKENLDPRLKYVAIIALILALLGLIPGNTITITL